MEIEALVKTLESKDAKAGCAAMEALAAESRVSAAVYPYLGRFFALLKQKSAYCRMRGACLIAENARWDAAGIIDRNLDAWLALFADEKPITVRRVLAAVPALAEAKPALRPALAAALTAMRPQTYADSMQPLIEKDRQNALGYLAALK